jgi:hypothetical protein
MKAITPIKIYITIVNQYCNSFMESFRSDSPSKLNSTIYTKHMIYLYNGATLFGCTFFKIL